MILFASLTYLLSNNELVTMLTELKAIMAPAVIG
jgi:hypothetical protein